MVDYGLLFVPLLFSFWQLAVVVVRTVEGRLQYQVGKPLRAPPSQRRPPRQPPPPVTVVRTMATTSGAPPTSPAIIPRADKDGQPAKALPVRPPPKPDPSLLDLPPEIRLQIYAYLLTVPPYNKLQIVRPATRLHVALLRTNRQIYAEATPILYHGNTFVAHPNLLAALPSLRRWYPPVREAVAAARIRRFHVRVRLDCEQPPYDAQTVAQSFSGREELTIEVWRAAFLGARREALEPFEAVRGVRRVKIFGSTSGFEDYVAWLEGAMKSPVGSDVPCFDSPTMERVTETDIQVGPVLDIPAQA